MTRCLINWVGLFSQTTPRSRAELAEIVVWSNGDMGHLKFSGTCRVEEFVSKSLRISITLEQYQLPAAIYHFVPEYEVRRIQY